MVFDFEHQVVNESKYKYIAFTGLNIVWSLNLPTHTDPHSTATQVILILRGVSTSSRASLRRRRVIKVTQRAGLIGASLV
jgi:hypothetical protein